MKTLITIAALAISACASPDYAQYAKSSEAASVARAQALTKIADSGDSSAKVAAVMALALGAGNNQLQAPQASAALQWAQVLVPGLTQVAGMRYSYLASVAQSNNSAAVAQSTNATMLGIASQIQAPGAITTLSGTGTLGSGTYNPPGTVSPTVVAPVVPTVPVVVVPDTVVAPDTLVVPDTVVIAPVVTPAATTVAP